MKTNERLSFLQCYTSSSENSELRAYRKEEISWICLFEERVSQSISCCVVMPLPRISNMFPELSTSNKKITNIRSLAERGEKRRKRENSNVTSWIVLSRTHWSRKPVGSNGIRGRSHEAKRSISLDTSLGSPHQVVLFPCRMTQSWEGVARRAHEKTR